MKVRKPDYYDKFKCIADKCDFTCCQQWKINVDEETHQKWKKNVPPGNTKVLQSNLAKYTRKVDGARVIALDGEGKCPFLGCDKLCQIVVKYGDEMIPNTCQIFPREKHDFDVAIEHTLMPCCPAVVDLINEATSFFVVTVDDGKSVTEDYDKNNYDYLTGIRDYFVRLVQDEEFSLEEAMLVTYYILSNEVPAGSLENNEFAKTFVSEIKKIECNAEDTFTECNELFLDLIDCYRQQGIYDIWLRPLWEMAEEIEADEEFMAKDIDDFKTVWKQYDALFRKIMAQEIYADLLLPEGDEESMTIKMQWLEMQFVFMRHMCYLKYKCSGNLSYHDVRDTIVLASRMMGYEEEDIYEYLENSFEDILWEWGYYFLLMGK